MMRCNAAYYAAHDPFGDFTTSPEISQVFGELLGAWAAVTWEAMGRPSRVVLAELGPGRGTLMQDALRTIRSVSPAFASSLSVHLIETSQRLRAIQADRVAATWHDRCQHAATQVRRYFWPTNFSMRCRSGNSYVVTECGESVGSSAGRFVERDGAYRRAGPTPRRPWMARSSRPMRPVKPSSPRSQRGFRLMAAPRCMPRLRRQRRRRRYATGA